MNDTAATSDEAVQAGEYVLGTLEAGERKRFQVKLMRSTKLRDQTNMWEQRLNEMGARIQPINPSPKVLAVIHKRIDGVTNADNVRPIRRNVISRNIISFASAAVIAFAVFIALEPLKQNQELYAPEAIAVFEQNKQPLLVVSISNDQLQVLANRQLPKLEQQDYELWAIAEGVDAPISLGVIPQAGALTLSRPEVFDEFKVTKLAVSIEDIGGSTTGAPTKVAYITDIFDV